MSDWLHGAYGDSVSDGGRVATNTGSAIVAVGTAPVHSIRGGANNVNVPVLVKDIAEAKKYFGYDDDWASYTLCEAIKHFFENKAVGPLILINVLDPATHKKGTQSTKSVTPENGRAVVAGAGSIILDTLEVASGSTEKTEGTDYSLSYNSAKQVLTLQELTPGALGNTALTLTYYEIKPDEVVASDVIGSTDGLGLNTGLYALKNVYQLTGYIPAYLICPGFSSVKSVHDAMKTVSRKINKHWDAYMFTDLPLLNGSTPLTMDTAYTYKTTNGYTAENEKVFFPMAKGADGKNYHLSVLAAAAMLELLTENSDIPYLSVSNTDAPIISNLYLGEDNTGRVYDDSIINDKLNRHGISSAAYVGGRWALWGAQGASYDDGEADYVNVADTNIMMLYYLSNDFQRRRPLNVDKPLTKNDLESLVREEQERLDGLKASGALIFGEAFVSAAPVENSDVYLGDYQFEFRVTTTPLAKSLSVVVTWVSDGYATYFSTAE